ncbi:MAG: sugar phosphate isomerase/epimerase family protein [Bryobacteraceae bacterium]
MGNTVTRRGFARIGGLAGLAAALGPELRSAQFDYPWKLGVISDEVSLDLPKALGTFFPKYKLEWTEIRNVRLNGKSSYVYRDATPDQIGNIRKQLDDAHVKLAALDTAVYKTPLPGTKPLGKNDADLHPAQGEYERQLEDLKHAADVAHKLGTNRLRIFTFARVADPDSIFQRILDELGKALEVAKQQDVVLMVENEFSCNTATGAESAKLFKAVPDKRLMHVWDPGNCYEAGEEPFPKAWDQLDFARIAHIHLKDAEGHEWKPIGAGKIDFVGQFKALKKIKYGGTMSLETHYKNAQRDIYTSSVESMDGLFRVLKNV